MDGLYSYCKMCQHEYQADRKATARAFVSEYLNSHPCVDCGERDQIVLEFDHMRDKEYEISKMVASGLNLESIKTEIEKCEVRCANCHRRRHFRARESKKALQQLRFA